jgi:hypothetical protein
MENVQQSHKSFLGRWAGRIAEHFEAAARVRRERAMAIWGDGATSGDWDTRPDRMYRMIGSAWAPRR